jgi:hypothetical protein
LDLERRISKLKFHVCALGLKNHSFKLTVEAIQLSERRNLVESMFGSAELSVVVNSEEGNLKEKEK